MRKCQKAQSEMSDVGWSSLGFFGAVLTELQRLGLLLVFEVCFVPEFECMCLE